MCLYAMKPVRIEKISVENVEALTKLILGLWPECSFEEEFAHCQKVLTDEQETFFLAEDQGEYVGFISLSVRTDYVEGSTTTPVAYLEGLYVKPEYRGTGIAKQLVARGEAWGQQKGCTQFASDTSWENRESILFHQRAGFREVNRIVCFIKDLT